MPPPTVALAERQLRSMARWHRASRYVVIWTGLGVGLGWMLGPDYWSADFDITHLRAVHVRLWGLLLVLHALSMIPMRARWYGSVMGALVYSALAGLFAAGIPLTHAWGAPWVYGACGWLSLLGTVFIQTPMWVEKLTQRYRLER